MEEAARKLKGMPGRKIQNRVIPPESDAEFAAGLEAVIETYDKLGNPANPVLYMDERPLQS